MRWLLAGLAFALAVALAIGTVAIRAENTRLRHRLDLDYRRIHDRIVELRRLSVRALDEGSPEQLAQALRAQQRMAARHNQRERQQWQ